jgi:tRNA-dihydrouridine synthase B
MAMDKLKIDGPVILGPMAGVTSLAYRDFMKPFGVALSYSEMISDCGIVYGNQLTLHYAKTSAIDHPVGLQIFGSDKEISVKAIGLLEQSAHYEILDLNLGCPVYKVTKTGAGSAWLRNPTGLYEYTKAVVAASHKPVSAKIRLGWDSSSINFREIASVLVGAGVSLLTIHARTTKQGYTGTADYEILRNYGKSLPIPLAISGDIFTPEGALKAMEITGASYVMVARGGLGNPKLVTNINHLYKGEPLEAPSTLLEEVDYAEDFANRLIAQEGERAAILQLRGLLPHFFSGFPGYKKIRAEISMNIQNADDLKKILAGIRNRERL